MKKEKLSQDTGFIVIHRKILDWEWWNDTNTTRLFFYLILKANWEDKKWRGITVKRGQVITGIFKLGQQTKMTVQQTRTALSKLKSTNEITIQSTNEYSLVTINKYNKYQDTNQQNNKRTTNEQQTNNKRVTTTKPLKPLKPLKPYREEKNLIKKDFSKIEDITEPVIQKLAEKYGVTTKYVEGKIEDMQDYTASTGKKYKDYKATLNLWIRRDKEKLSNSPKHYAAGKTAYYVEPGGK